MTYLSNLFQGSRITEKLSRELLKHSLHVCLLILCIIIIILTPLFYKDALIKRTEYAELIRDQYEQFSTFIINNLSYISSDPDLSDLLRTAARENSIGISSQINLKLQSLSACYERIKLIVIEDESGTIYHSYSDFDLLEILTSDSGYQNFQTGNGTEYSSPIYRNTSTSALGSHYILMSRRYKIYTQNYIISIIYNVDSVLTACENICEKGFNSYAVYSEKNDSVLYQHNSLGFKDISTLSKKSQARNGYSICSSGIYFIQEIVSLGWTIYCFSTWVNLLSTLFLILSIVLLVYISSSLLSSLFILKTSTKYLLPINILTNEIADFQAENVFKSNIETDDEVEILSHALENMSLKIHQQLLDIQEYARQNFTTQYTLLATQINPHTIYNALNIVNILAKQNNMDGVIDVNTAIGKLLRERLNNSFSIFETVANEVDTTQQFVLLMKYRYSNHIVTSINVDSELFEEKIPKNLLIPILENAYYHGLSDENSVMSGNIDINIYSMDDQIIIEISDDGKGIDEVTLDALKNNNYTLREPSRFHIGLGNVYKRLQYIYQDQFTFDVQSTLGYGTTFSIVIPFFETISSSSKFMDIEQA